MGIAHGEGQAAGQEGTKSIKNGFSDEAIPAIAACARTEQRNYFERAYMEETVQRTWGQRYPEGKREKEKKEEAKHN